VEKEQNPSNFVCCTPLSEHFKNQPTQLLNEQYMGPVYVNPFVALISFETTTYPFYMTELNMLVEHGFTLSLFTK
jgi:hypothetical protein